MTNTTIFNELINGYNELACTHNYMFGFEDRGTIYCAVATAEVLKDVCTLDKASRGAGYSLRFKPNKAQKEFLKTFELFPICSTLYFKQLVNDTIYNRGEIFEKLVTEFFGQIWEKDNVPFTQGGDLEVDGIAYQLKFEKATFTNEKTLKKLQAGR